MVGDVKLALSLPGSKSGSTASLLGTGVSDEPDGDPTFLENKFEGVVLLLTVLAGREAGDPVEGVF